MMIYRRIFDVRVCQICNVIKTMFVVFGDNFPKTFILLNVFIKLEETFVVTKELLGGRFAGEF